MKRISAVALLPAVLSFALAGCEAQKSSTPLSPSVAGPIAGVNITPPRLVEPGQGFRYKESQQPIRLIIENASTSGVRPITYMFEVAADADFNSKVFARNNVPPGEGGRTTVQVDRLDIGRAYSGGPAPKTAPTRVSSPRRSSKCSPSRCSPRPGSYRPSTTSAWARSSRR